MTWAVINYIDTYQTLLILIFLLEFIFHQHAIEIIDEQASNFAKFFVSLVPLTTLKEVSSSR